MKIKKFFDDIIVKYYKHKARRKLLASKREDLAVFSIIENYLTSNILDGNTSRREELNEIQRKIEEFGKFINFIKKTK
jgi:hypothetical protein